MRAVIQRVNHASVKVQGEIVGQIGTGLLTFIGFTDGDSLEQGEALLNKISNMRIFEDANGKMNLSLRDVNGQMLIVSQFTLYAQTRKSGRRPSFSDAMESSKAGELYSNLLAKARELGICAQSGVYAANMQVSLENDGPVTIILEA
ncbi:MAG: D-aminoacyl-tRNA deacylase [Eubacteriaceae bacterium]|nr:D-aminoacyl-tRNA deacylase [Eubacteriaceae bacterium]